MTTRGSVKETGEEIPDRDWKRFEAAVGVADKKRDGDEATDQPFRDEVERPDVSGRDQTRADAAGDPKRIDEAAKTTKRTE